jgi:hypothetical protein
MHVIGGTYKVHESNENAYKFLVRTPEGQRPLGRYRSKREDNIKVDHKELGYEGLEWIQLPQNRIIWRVPVSRIMGLKLYRRWGIYLPDERTRVYPKVSGPST